MSVTAKALWYIEGHLNGAVSLDAIASSAGVTRYHLSRAFSEATGSGIASYVRGRRLSAAANALAQGAGDILSVALDAGYSSHEAFTRAFHQYFGLTPEQARAQARSQPLTLLEPITMPQLESLTISPARTARREAMLLFGLSESYTPRTRPGIAAQWERFVPHIGQIPNQIGRVAYGVICQGDDAGNFDYLCGIEVSEYPSQPREFTRLRLAPATYTVFLHPGHISGIGATCNAIWNRGLSEAGYQAADAPWFELYNENFDGRTGLGGVEIWVPVVT